MEVLNIAYIVITLLVCIASGISAYCWWRSSIIDTPKPKAYLSGPPPEVVKQIQEISTWNLRAAQAAGFAAFFLCLQSIISLIQTSIPKP